VTLTVNGVEVGPLKMAVSDKGTFGLKPGGEMSFGNLFVRELKK
jgi:hypothetical protein